MWDGRGLAVGTCDRGTERFDDHGSRRSSRSAGFETSISRLGAPHVEFDDICSESEGRAFASMAVLFLSSTAVCHTFPGDSSPPADGAARSHLPRGQLDAVAQRTARRRRRQLPDHDVRVSSPRSLTSTMPSWLPVSPQAGGLCWRAQRVPAAGMELTPPRGRAGADGRFPSCCLAALAFSVAAVAAPAAAALSLRNGSAPRSAATTSSDDDEFSNSCW